MLNRTHINMRHKYKIMLHIILMFLIFLTSCKNQVIENVEKEKIVKVRVIETINYPLLIEYYGRLEPKTLKKYSFKLGGKLEEVNVEIGDAVSSGDLLATLDSFEVDLGLDASTDQLKMAMIDAEKAEDAYAFYLDHYDDMMTLYNAEGISLQQLDEAKLKKDSSEKDLEQARKKKQQAEIDMRYKSKTVEDTGLISEIEGYVADIYYEEGELVPQGYPAIIVRSFEQVAKVSVTLKDIKKIKIGDMANILIEGTAFNGIVSHIDLVPNQATRTYGVEVAIDTDVSFVLGQDCHIEIQDDSQSREGIWLNINEIMNDGADYVYVVKDKRAFRKNIETHEIYKDKVRVTGLLVKDQVIIEGRNGLTEGYKVIVEGEINESDN